MKRFLCLFAFFLLHVTLSAAQTATVTRNVNLRPDASTNGAPIASLKTGAQVEVLDSAKTSGFLHVKMQDGTEGWAWARSLRIEVNPEAGSAQHVGPESLYPTKSMTPGKPDTLKVDDLTRRYSEGCPASKTSCTYSQAHRDVPGPVHKKVYDEYNVPQARRNIKNGEVDHFYPLCAGGSNDISNLWYQPADNQWNGKDFGFHAKDRLETYICAQIVDGKLDPQEAYDRMTGDWVKFYIDVGLDDTD